MQSDFEAYLWSEVKPLVRLLESGVKVTLGNDTITFQSKASRYDVFMDGGEWSLSKITWACDCYVEYAISLIGKEAEDKR